MIINFSQYSIILIIYLYSLLLFLNKNDILKSLKNNTNIYSNKNKNYTQLAYKKFLQILNKTSIINDSPNRELQYQNQLKIIKKKRLNNVIKIDITKENYSKLTQILYDNALTGSELFFNFTEDYYSGIQELDSASINVYNNITFYSEKPVTLDLLELKPYSWFINFNIGTGLTEKVFIKFENIIFKNFINYPFLVYVIYMTPLTDNYQVSFENCSFYNCGDVLINFYTCKKSIQEEPQYIFNNCHFEYD
ncbi:hypothetical protein PIROE2DRAFT_6931 [Piromyces sp. E2]|nr:hypothetical protein PIROE2DRAFT_6931 [Piromyces sp. E2]|eukprot:OUM65947.1 hypothetical protein PIROE2DRAFT_6931 [Piromyces sp. E2]